jgi:hypothetical protein
LPSIIFKRLDVPLTCPVERGRTAPPGASVKAVEDNLDKPIDVSDKNIETMEDDLPASGLVVRWKSLILISKIHTRRPRRDGLSSRSETSHSLPTASSNIASVNILIWSLGVLLKNLF